MREGDPLCICGKLPGEERPCLRCECVDKLTPHPPTRLWWRAATDPDAQCRSSSAGTHHWLLGEGGFTSDGEWFADYGCKHCDALGDPCPECGADPECDDEPRDPNCLACGGNGIVVVKLNHIDEDEQ